MKTFILLITISFHCFKTGFSQAGKLDSTFGTNGTVSIHFVCSDKAIQRDGKIVVVGSTIARFNNDGSRDSTFSDGGDGSARMVALQSGGNIIVAASNRIARYNSNGSLDMGFGENGKIISDFEVVSLAVQSDDKIVVIGSILIDCPNEEWCNFDFAIARYNTDGTPDSTFSQDGQLTTDFGFVYEDYAEVIVMQKDGKIVVAGTTMIYGEERYTAIARYNTNGTLDSSFSEDGKIETTFLGDNTWSLGATRHSLAVQNDGKIVLATSIQNGALNFTLARFNRDGTLDSTFSNDGMLTHNLVKDDNGFSAISLAIQSDGRIVAGGSSNLVDEYSPGGSAILRLNKAGSLDSTFGTNGIVIPEFYTIKITDSENKLYAIGEARNRQSPGILARFVLEGVNGDPPTVKITSPVDGAKYISPATIILSADASDKDGKVKTVEFYNGDSLIFTEHAPPFFKRWYNVPAGEYNITAKATDNDGLITASAPVHISVVPNIPPIVSITTPVNNVTYGAGAYIKINATASDADGTISKVNFYNGNTLLHTETVFPYGYQWKHVPAGNYTLTVKATDNNGLATASAPVHITVVPNIAPTVNITNPANNKTIAGPSTIRLSAEAKDPDGKITSVEFFNGTTLLKIEYKFPYTFAWKNVPVGNYSITAKAMDDLGAVITSAVVNISVVPNKAPTVSITNPANEESFTAPATIPLIASAKDPDGSISRVEFYSGTTLLNTQYESPYTHTMRDVPAGTYTITAKAIDNLGLSAISAPITITVGSQNTLTVSSKPSVGNNKTGVKDAASLKVYPNPAGNTLNIYHDELQQNKKLYISVISASGVEMKTMQTNTSTQTIQLNVSSLAKGVYTIKMISGDKVLYKQFVKL